MHPSILILATALAACSSTATLSAQEGRDARTLRVFLLAGQSNMEGQAVVDLDHEKHYNGGRGNLEKVLADPQRGANYHHLRGEDGEWTTRDDVAIWYRAGGDRLKTGMLSIGYAVYDDPHHFGPELQFGHYLGEHFDAPVLLIKTCWGGKSLFKDFRPPSSGGETGPFYKKMIAEYREAIETLPQHFPELADYRPELTGFVWFQGWNDMFDEQAREEYADNLGNLIRDVRKELKAPNLPTVVGETGNAPNEEFRAAQAAGCKAPEFRKTVRFVPTRAFLRPAEDSPNTTHGHHWYGNAESYLLIGDAMGQAMISLLDGNADR
ncbi:MAG: sialate O-acetylesterase [Planctomycetota bacterium]|nr:sialate O-acetylesterase [Planctomycetota bacterium]